MRISDWSSDVCSSDLSAVRRSGPRSRGGAGSPRCAARQKPVQGRRVARLMQECCPCPAAYRLSPMSCERSSHCWRSWDSDARSEEHTSELQSLMRISYDVFCLKKTIKKQNTITDTHIT